MPNSVTKLAGAKSEYTEFKSRGTAPVSIFPSIVPAPTAQSRAAGGLSQQWDGMCTGYAHDLFDKIQRVFSQRE